MTITKFSVNHIIIGSSLDMCEISVFLTSLLMFLLFLNFKTIEYNGGHGGIRVKLVAIISLISSLCQVQAGIGGRHSRQLSEVEASATSKHYCMPFFTNYQFSSPANPGEETYPSNVECVLVIQAPPGHLIKLDFRDYFQIEPSPECTSDYLEIRNGPHGYDDLIGRYCGLNVFPPIITSKDRYLWMRFKSDETVEYKGFKAVYQFVPRPAHLKSPEIMPCEISRTDPKHGQLNIRDIPTEIIEFDTKHALPIDCLWSITVKEDWKIQLQFDKFSLGNPHDCDSNFVQVFSTDTDMQSEERKFCGVVTVTVLSRTNEMYVRFYSRSTDHHASFVANYSAYRDLAPGESQCESDEFYCNDATCIHRDLQCDGKYDCRSRFDEDECVATEFLPLEGPPQIILVIFLVTLSGMFIAFMYKCVTKLIRDCQRMQEKSKGPSLVMTNMDKSGIDEAVLITQ